MKKLRLALMGFGNVGQAFAEMLLAKHDEIALQYGVDVKVTVIATNSKGNIYMPEGINLRKVLDDVTATGKFADSDMTDQSDMQLLVEAEYDCIVEMTPLNIFTGQPATDRLKTAMNRGKHAITANKGPIAWFYKELKALAASKGVGFFYETVVVARRINFGTNGGVI